MIQHNTRTLLIEDEIIEMIVQNKNKAQKNNNSIPKNHIFNGIKS